ncbi:hypothetical protein ACMD2_00928 [Ananas comosus]|nr:hypothetical protein ACMD2_00928 [Ananas comosus]CAD1827883.1 unnamed protein product [Ananas comosus var. bracteatus]
MSCNRRLPQNSCRFQLEQDVKRLQQLLQEETNLRAVLENALEHAAVTLSDLSYLPNNAQELLSNISTLETTILRLEEEMISLHFQLIQERNERRLAEYRLKQLPLQPFPGCSHQTETGPLDGKIAQEELAVPQVRQREVGKLQKQVSVKGLCNYPNKLSEEIVRCMRNIFISLADSSVVYPKSSAQEKLPSSPSPTGRYSVSSYWSLSEPRTTSSWEQSPQVVSECSNELLASEGAFDPYRDREKLGWADIGNYGLATEVSWMSVGKKQLEYAAEALREFRSLIEQLGEVNPVQLNHEERLAFWINLYNALMMHAYLAYGVPRSDMKLFSLMQKAAYTVGGHSFSAACIEYVILKMKLQTYRPQTAFLLALHKLKTSEEHKKFSIEKSEPLIAFALSCGMFSSPAVKIYTPINVREELQDAQRDFIRASVGVSRKGKLMIPKMLQCFARSFVDDANLAMWVPRFLPQQQAAFVEQCISQRRQSVFGSHSFGILPFDSRFRYLFLPEKLP